MRPAISRPALYLCAALLLVQGSSGQHGVPRSSIRDADVFFGADAGGNTTPGAQVPFGFISLQPDMEGPTTSGYRTGARILGFSHTHESGTGGASKYGNFLVTPTLGNMTYPVPLVASNEHASPGYYTVVVGSGAQATRVELTASRLVGFHRYTFPRTARANLVITVSSVVVNWSGTPQRPLACSADAGVSGEVTGSCEFRGGWNGSPYKLFFAAGFNRAPEATGTGSGSKPFGTASHVETNTEWQPAFAWASFDARKQRTVELKVAVSFLSVERASATLEQAEAMNFDSARASAESAWTEALGRIQVEGGSAAQRSLFVSSLYRSHVMPHDLTGENAWWDSAEPHYEDFYTIWDTFRTLHPLLLLIQPDRERDMLRSLVDTYRHTGWIPDGRVAGANGLTQGGSNGDILIADAMVKGLEGVDYETAYQALLKDATVDSPDPFYVGREKMSLYTRLGYLPLPVERSGSRTMEYSYDDFAIAQVASLLHKDEDSRTFRQRSLDWTNLWDPTTQSIRPRHEDGSWMEPFDRKRLTKAWSEPFYEGTPWEYSTFVPHDVQGLINRTGGDAEFVRWLDAFFAQGQYDPGNEPDFLAAWLYMHAGRPDLTQQHVRQLLETAYRPGRAGLPGNDDAGAMTSWYVWSSIGLFPNAGQDYYYIGSPVFSRSTIHMPQATFVIEARDPSRVNRYIQSATLNGNPLPRLWLRHSELIRGGKLVLDLGPKLSAWGSTQPPFSLEAAPSHRPPLKR